MKIIKFFTDYIDCDEEFGWFEIIMLMVSIGVLVVEIGVNFLWQS